MKRIPVGSRPDLGPGRRRTMISTARLVGDGEALVLGINYGSLGYLTEFRIEEMFPALSAL